MDFYEHFMDFYYGQMWVVHEEKLLMDLNDITWTFFMPFMDFY